jgi:serine protease AprX
MSRRTKILIVILSAFFVSSMFHFSNRPKAAPAAATSTKISPDLLPKLRGAGGDNRVPVVIQLKAMPDRDIDTLLTGYGARIVRVLKRLNVRVVDVPLNAVHALASRSEVRYISPDRQVATFGHVAATTGTDAVRVRTTTSLLGLVTTTTVFDGTGVGVAIIDSGIDEGHLAFRNQLGVSRVIARQDFTGENRTDDVFGHGTHVAAIAAGNNQISNGEYTGIASNANLVNLRVLDSQGRGSTSNLLAALDWVMTYHSVYGIRVVNMSLGTTAIDSYTNDPICQAVRAISNAGITVVAAAGNDGKSSSGQKLYGQIHSPGNEPSALTVGATNSFGTDGRNDDSITTYSSRGPTRSYATDENGLRHYDNLLKPDITAPGNRIVSAAAANNCLLTAHPELDANVSSIPDRRMMYMSGSSMAAPIAAGTAALLLQANPTLTPSLIKAILMYTAQPLSGANMLEQGTGEINVEGAMRLVQLVRTDLTNYTPLGAPLLNGTAPAQVTILNNETFYWSQGIILNHTYAKNSDLITKYQKVYGSGWILADGIAETSTSQNIITTRMTAAILLGTNIVSSDGTVLGNGPAFLDLNFLLGDGLMLADGLMVGDGIMIGDGIMVGDGVMVGDGWLQAQSILTAGDDSACMR